jgi:hypothetical protein
MWIKWLFTVASLMNSRGGRLAVGAAGGDQLEDLELPLAERFLAWRADPAQQPRRDRGREHRLAVRGRPHRPEQLTARRVLEQVAGGARLDGGQHVAVGVVGGQHQDPRGDTALGQLLDGGHPVQPRP